MSASTSVWVSPEPLNWPARWSSGTQGRDDEWRRAYEMVAHADARLCKDANEFARTDALTALKRGVDHRIRTLYSKYFFRAIPIREKPADPIELLAWRGLIRPTLLRELRLLRNAVEHEDAAPADTKTCQVLADFAWFFLRATDRYIQERVETFCFYRDPNASHHIHWVQVTVDPTKSWTFTVDGWLPPTHIEQVPRDGWLQLYGEPTRTYREVLLSSPQAMDIRTHLPSDRSADDLRFKGVLRGPAAALRFLIQRYFEVS